jgi:general secretion pathway protein J
MSPSLRASTTRENGFTLLELMIAITIFSIIASFVYAGLNIVLESKRQNEQYLGRLAKLQLGLHLMQQDIEQAIDRPARDEFGDVQPALRGGGLSNLPLELTRSGYANPMKAARSQLQRVGYLVEDKSLYRVSWAVLDRAQDSEPRRQKLFDGVENLTLSFFDQSMKRQNAWPPTQMGSSNETPPALPKGVEVVIETATMGNLRRVFKASETMPGGSQPK